MENFTCTINTKVDAESLAETRTLTIDLSLLSDEDFAEYARRAIVVQAQAAWRAWMKSDKSKPSPWAGDVYKVPKPGTRTADPAKAIENAKKQLAKLSPEQIAKLLESL